MLPGIKFFVIACVMNAHGGLCEWRPKSEPLDDYHECMERAEQVNGVCLPDQLMVTLIMGAHPH